MQVAYRSFQPLMALWFGRWKLVQITALRHYPGCWFFCCQTRILAVKTCKAQLNGNLCDIVFMYGGFSNWNNATVGSTKRQSCYAQMLCDFAGKHQECRTLSSFCQHLFPWRFFAPMKSEFSTMSVACVMVKWPDRVFFMLLRA